MRLINLDEFIPQLADKADKELTDIIDQSKKDGINYDAINYYNGVKYGLKKAAILANDFQTVPTINPVVRGKWIEKEIFGPKDTFIQLQSARCSVCKRYLTTPYMYYFNNYEYCPHCGAKMDGVEG